MPLSDEHILFTETSGFIETDGVEQTFKFSQRDISSAVDQQSKAKIFDLNFNQPHISRFDRNGQYLLLSGSKGRTSLRDWRTQHIVSEFNVAQDCYDACFLHNYSLHSIAQKQGVFIYDQKGTEIHALKHHNRARKLVYLPYHYLLVSGGLSGKLTYQDTSTGDVVATIPTKSSCLSLSFDPSSAIVFHGDSKGVVSLWSPNVNAPLVQVLAHKGAITASCVDLSGNYLISSGKDFTTSVHDLRTLSLLHSYKNTSPCSSLTVSATGVIAMGMGTKVQLWQDAVSTKAKSPYLNHHCSSLVHSVEFCPYEDVLGIGTASGYSSILVPGSANPFETKRQRREAEVKRVLEKIPADLITFDKNVGLGKVSIGESERMRRMKELEMAAGVQPKRTREELKERKEKRKTRGRNSTLKRFLRKRANVVDARREAVRSELNSIKQSKVEAIELSSKKYLSKFSKYKRS
ncbi:hypothetical protein GEMRC1_007117 [Eukaryota sp. GEM-RC1]